MSPKKTAAQKDGDPEFWGCLVSGLLFAATLAFCGLVILGVGPFA